MTQAVAARPRWMITTRTAGEVLAAGAESEDSQILLLGVPSGFTPSEVEGWLRDLIGVARETSRHDSEERPIPVLLHHTLTGLLFSHTELWDRAGSSRPCSLAFVQTGEAAGFGWVGEVEPSVRLNGQPVAIQWVRVRDHSGREARAFAVDASHEVVVRLEWAAAPDAADAPTISLLALWSAGGAQTAPQSTPVAPEAETAPPAWAELERPAEVPASATQPPPVYAIPPLPPPVEEVEPDEDIEQEPAYEIPDEPPPMGLEAEIKPIGDFDEFPAASESAPGSETATEPAPASDDVQWLQPEPELKPEPEPEPEPQPEWEPEPASEHEPVEAPAPVRPAAPEPEPVASATPRARESAPPGGWTTVYESGSPPVMPRDPIGDIRRRGFFAWVTSLMQSRSKPDVTEVVARAPVAPARSPEVVAPPPVEPVRAAAVESPAVAAPVTFEPPPGPALEIEHPPATARPTAASGPRSQPFRLSDQPDLLDPPPPPTRDLIVEPPLPEMVPPTPEPPELTARTVDWRSPVEAPEAAAMPDAADVESTAAAPESAPAAPRWKRPVRSWPVVEEEAAPRRRLFQKPWAWGVVIAILFAGGWLVGTIQDDKAAGPNPITRALRSIGIGGARYDVVITTHPGGAWIAVDGKDIARRTPATIELTPGEHFVALSLADLGSASYTVRGERGDRVKLDATLFGSLAIRGSDSGMPIAVTVDGHAVGFVPVSLDSLTPGPHEVRFSGPGMASWGSTVTVRVGELTETIAHPMTSPATGVIEIRAVAAGEDGSAPMNGATVWVDGEKRGLTPLTLELPRGPHSVKVEFHGETAPVQVIDLPGGNQRFATFEFGIDVQRGSLVPIAPPAKIAFDRPSTISVALQGVTAGEVREMWLHVRTPDGTWRRYQMMMLKATGAIVGVAVYPPTMFDERGRGRWYASAITQTGDEYYTEIQPTEVAAPPPPR